MSKFKTRQEVAYELGISRSTLYRLIKKNQIKVRSGLLNLEAQHKIIELVHQDVGYPGRE